VKLEASTDKDAMTVRPARTKRIKNATKRAKSAIASESAKPKMA
jgi:hypothetical protein